MVSSLFLRHDFHKINKGAFCALRFVKLATFQAPLRRLRERFD